MTIHSIPPPLVCHDSLNTGFVISHIHGLVAFESSAILAAAPSANAAPVVWGIMNCIQILNKRFSIFPVDCFQFIHI